MKKLLLGLLVLGVVFLVAGMIFKDTGLALIAVCIALILLPPSFDPAIIIKEWQVMTGKHSESPPSCYKSNPEPQQRAENDCGYCPWNRSCLTTEIRETLL